MMDADVTSNTLGDLPLALLSVLPSTHRTHTATGYVLFQNSSLQGMLARMMSVLGPFPESLLLFGKETNKFFTSRCV